MTCERLSPSPIEASPQTALLVDDEPDMRTYVSGILRRGGFQVYEAADGMDALSFLRSVSGAVDLLVTDIRMPRMTGTELAGVVRNDFPEIPIVFISGEQPRWLLDDPEARTIFLLKPFQPQAILEAVRIVSRRPLQDR
jgi:CheY-like chemotaxis protein